MAWGRSALRAQTGVDKSKAILRRRKRTRLERVMRILISTMNIRE